MENKEKVWEIPYGTRDFLPREAAEKRAIETAIAEEFNRWGYDEIVTPTVELLDTLTAVSGSDMEPQDDYTDCQGSRQPDEGGKAAVEAVLYQQCFSV